MSTRANIVVHSNGGPAAIHQQYDGVPDIVVPRLREILSNFDGYYDSGAAGLAALYIWRHLAECNPGERRLPGVYPVPPEFAKELDVTYTYDLVHEVWYVNNEEHASSRLAIRTFGNRLLYEGPLDQWTAAPLGTP